MSRSRIESMANIERGLSARGITLPAETGAVVKRVIHTTADFSFAEGAYEPERFLEAVRGFENIPEGGERCRKCFELRLSVSAEYAAANGFEYFTTSLTISPLKNSQLLNELGLAVGESYGVKYLTSDFKKQNGAKRSIELSKKYGQDQAGSFVNGVLAKFAR